jgi:hypothetical protein
MLNEILTHFYEFRLYRDGELIKHVSIGRPSLAKKLETPLPPENETAFFDLLETFFSFSLPRVHSAKTLTSEPAKRTRFLRDEVISIEMAEAVKTAVTVYDEQKKRIYINESKYFDPVSPEVWAYYIGGYQVLQKYLKDRKGGLMDDPRHFCRIITALVITQEIQEQLDEIYPEIESDLLSEELPR